MDNWLLISTLRTCVGFMGAVLWQLSWNVVFSGFCNLILFLNVQVLWVVTNISVGKITLFGSLFNTQKLIYKKSMYTIIFYIKYISKSRIKHFLNLLADPGKARGFSINTFLINWLSRRWFVKISLQRPHALMVADGAFSQKIDYVTIL